MKHAILILFSLVLISNISAQSKKDKSKEIGLGAGTAYYLGELNRQHFGGELSVGMSVFYRQNIDKRWSFNFGLNMYEVSAFDSASEDPWKVNRNLHFKNQIVEGAFLAELNFFPYQLGSKHEWVTPYLFSGLSYYAMNPKAEFQGVWYELQPLGTEGQGTTAGQENYNLNGIALTYGLGLRMNITGRLGLNLSYGMRSASTDYIDDVSTTYADPNVLAFEAGALTQELSDRSFIQLGNGNASVERGDPTNNDFYAFTTFALTLRIDAKATSCWGGR